MLRHTLIILVLKTIHTNSGGYKKCVTKKPLEYLSTHFVVLFGTRGRQVTTDGEFVGPANHLLKSFSVGFSAYLLLLGVC